MSKITALDYIMATQGIKIMHLGPLGPNYSEREWIKWLEYIPEFQQQRINYLLKKETSKLTNSEIEELRSFRKEMKVRTISKNYENEETSVGDRLEYMAYSTQKNLDSIIRKKLTDEEYKSAVVRIKKIMDTLSYEELRQYCESVKNNFDAYG